MNFETEIALNNYAVKLLRKGYLRDAACSLKTAISNMKDEYAKREMASPAVVVSHCSRNSENHDSYSCGNRPPLSMNQPYVLSAGKHWKEEGALNDNAYSKLGGSDSDDLMYTVPVLHTLHSTVLEQAYLALYKKAFVLMEGQSEQDIITSAILFNMGLTYHLHGIHCNKSRMLLDALGFYKIAFTIWHQNDSLPPVMLLLAVLNNAAHVNALLYLRDQMIECLDCMEWILSETQLNDASEEDFDFFILNITLIIRGRELTLAPVA